MQELFAAYGAARLSATVFEATTKLLRQQLIDIHRFPLSTDDLSSIDYVLNAFYSDGPEIDYGRSRPGSDPRPSYRELMVQKDVRGQSRSYLASEEAFGFVKNLHVNNLIVPVVGDFGTADGAIDRVGDYVRRHQSAVSAFYSSNVEVYLSNQQMVAFCGSLAALPVQRSTSFISSRGPQRLREKLAACPRRSGTD